MIKQYKQIDMSGDVGLKVWGQTLEELFENAATGVSELITDVSALPETETREVHVVADSSEDLLVLWLNELVFLFDSDNYVGRSFAVSIADNKLKAKISGTTFDPSEYESRLLIKAATYHDLTVCKTSTGWEATVIFDI
jgi:SHS2 domain-containing protein